MSTVLGVNAVFHDPAAAVVVDGTIVAACEEERFSRRKHGKQAVPFSTWELPEASMRACLDMAGLRAEDLDAVAYSYDPTLAPQPTPENLASGEWEGLRTLYAMRAPSFISTALPGVDPCKVRFVRHHRLAGIVMFGCDQFIQQRGAVLCVGSSELLHQRIGEKPERRIARHATAA